MDQRRILLFNLEAYVFILMTEQANHIRSRQRFPPVQTTNYITFQKCLLI